MVNLLVDSFKNPVDPDKSILIRASELPSLRECPRKWYFQSPYGLNIEPLRKDKKLRFGSCWHDALEKYYQTGSIEEAKGQFIIAVDEELERLVENLGPEIYEEERDGLEKDIELGKTLLDLYGEKSEELDPPDSSLEVIATEHRFLIPIGNTDGENFDSITVYLAGKLDGIVRDQNGGIWGMEHKSMSTSADVTAPENLVLDLQTTIQIMLLNIYYHNKMGGSENVMGALYNLARKQKPGPRVKKEIFGRHRIKRTAKELAILHRMILHEDVEMIKRWTNTLPMRIPYNPQLFGRCSWGCSYKDICESLIRGEDASYLVKTNYKKRDKDIYEVLKEEMQGQNELWEVSC